MRTFEALASDFAAFSASSSQMTTSWNSASRVSSVATRIQQTAFPDGV
jgi:hypothetical protein